MNLRKSGNLCSPWKLVPTLVLIWGCEEAGKSPTETESGDSSPRFAATKKTPPPTLTGEVLALTTTSATPTVTQQDCESENQTFTYTVSGTAVGPYPGTYTETGTVILSDPTIFPQIVQSFDATFTITSATGKVSGTKTLTAPGGLGVCLTIRASQATNLLVDYEATITTPDRQNFVDHGVSSLNFVETLVAPATEFTTNFTEDFASDLGEVFPCAQFKDKEDPSKSRCKDE